ncbi:MAG: bifunctional DNA-formamidopyrimidine glycosylase/DNA-(apurinic or apyrimidinic site) lyase [Candidatus Zixiibacteriota bacterium]|nr:MAG: bifunctional DNA-formamidopyrimidine glycosylase/DNA-(apurinic or apyrimidinic site) lyase [candidate division Zixibacteria bacterium]
MPELPEVETVVRGLRKTILDKAIASVSSNNPKIDSDNQPGWLGALKGKRFLAVRRRGKNILIDVSGGYTLWIHLKMTGHLYFLPENVVADKHDLLIFKIKSNSHQLRFNDYRRFGRVRLFRSDEVMHQPGLADLGPEPLEITRKQFIDLFRSARRMVKPALLDQTFLAGLGNIYADESLYMAGIHPRKLTDKISKAKLIKLHKKIRSVLKKAIRLMGTSVDSYAGVNGRPGGFQKYLRVYGREGEPCPRCGTGIRREKIGSRSAHFCPRCQRLK